MVFSEEMLAALKRKVLAEFKEYCRSDSVLKGTDPDQLSSFSNRLLKLVIYTRNRLKLRQNISNTRTQLSPRWCLFTTDLWQPGANWTTPWGSDRTSSNETDWHFSHPSRLLGQWYFTLLSRQGKNEKFTEIKAGSLYWPLSTSLIPTLLLCSGNAHAPFHSCGAPRWACLQATQRVGWVAPMFSFNTK